MHRAFLALLLVCQASPATAGEFWQLKSSGSTASLRGIAAVSESCCWASGAKGTVLRTVDGGATWKFVGPPMTADADFRDIHAWDDKTAIIMSAGDVDRLYRTDDGGQSWKIVFEERDANAFFDGIALDLSGTSGWLMGDPLDGRVYLLRTVDGGKSWSRHAVEKSPQVENGLAAFAASGTHLLLRSNGELVIGLGGLPEKNSAEKPFEASVLRSTDHGESWKQIAVPIRSNASSGIFSLCEVSADGNRLVAVGGDYQQVQSTESNIAVSDDGGITWKKPTGSCPSGFRSAIVRVPLKELSGMLVTTGPNGTDQSTDSGESWRRISDEGFHTMSVSPDGFLWAAGSEGRIAKAILP